MWWMLFGSMWAWSAEGPGTPTAVVIASGETPGWSAPELTVFRPGPLRVEVRVEDGEGEVQHEVGLVADASPDELLALAKPVGAGELAVLQATVGEGRHTVRCQTPGHESERTALHIAAPYTGPVVAADAKPSHPNLKVIRRVAPTYPDELKKASLTPTSCKTMLFIDTRGKVQDVAFMDCPVGFQASAREALMQWTFYPPKANGGRPSEATFLVKVLFQLKRLGE